MALPREIMDFLTELAREENLRTSVFRSAKGGLITGAGAMAAGFVMGPIGFLVGGALFGAVSAAVCDDHQPLHQVLENMSEERKRLLAARIECIMERANVRDIANFAAMAAIAGGPTNLRNDVIRELTNFVANELRLSVVR